MFVCLCKFKLISFVDVIEGGRVRVRQIVNEIYFNFYYVSIRLY